MAIVNPIISKIGVTEGRTESAIDSDCAVHCLRPSCIFYWQLVWGKRPDCHWCWFCGCCCRAICTRWFALRLTDKPTDYSCVARRVRHAEFWCREHPFAASRALNATPSKCAASRTLSWSCRTSADLNELPRKEPPRRYRSQVSA
jgi:hypothetical protein